MISYLFTDPSSRPGQDDPLHLLNPDLETCCPEPEKNGDLKNPGTQKVITCLVD
jgi:hypothetical protein